MNKNATEKETKKETKKILYVIAQAFYGNRTLTETCEENMDRFILGYLDSSMPIEYKIDRTIVHLPCAENLVLVYNKYQEEREIERKDRLLKEKNIRLKPLAVIPELDLTLYSCCIVCRMNENGEFESLEGEDCSLFMNYLAK